MGGSRRIKESKWGKWKVLSNVFSERLVDGSAGNSYARTFRLSMSKFKLRGRVVLVHFISSITYILYNIIKFPTYIYDLWDIDCI